MKVKSEVAESYPTPSDPMDCSLPGSSVHGIFQARVLEWGAIAFYPAIKRNEILKFTTTWMNLEGITQSDISQIEKDKYHYDITYMQNLKCTTN